MQSPQLRKLALRKAAMRLWLRAKLAAFFATGRRLALPAAADPDISVIVVVYNQPALVYGCLRAAGKAFAAGGLRAEFIVFDNASGAVTRWLLGRLAGARVLVSKHNLHFLRGVNRAAAAATGRHLLLLNSDAMLHVGAVEAALATLERAPDVGAVGARIVLPDGALQEAGSIIWRDGSCAGYGRHDDPLGPVYMYRRDADYCSGAFLLTPRAVWSELEGFDERYAPCYYEETDYCVRLWRRGLRVVYEPDALVTHYEFGSSSMSEGTQYQALNQAVFVERHADWLATRASRHDGEARALRAVNPGRKRILVLEDRVPHERLGSGYPRANLLLRELAAAGAQVTLFPLLHFSERWPDIRSSVDPAVEVIIGRLRHDLHGFLAARRGYYDGIVVCRPHNMQRLLDAIGADETLISGSTLIYDAEAVYAPREALQHALGSSPLSDAEVERRIDNEIALARRAHSIVAVSPDDAAFFGKHGAPRVWVLGHALRADPTPEPWESRSGLVFMGAYEPGSPNEDSLVWFCTAILPRVRALLDEPVRLTVLGRGDAGRLRALAIDNLELAGMVEDVRPWLGRARVMIAPTRAAAGLPHKVHHAAALGVPIVTTELIARQTGWTHGRELVASGDEAGFAMACARLYRDRALWSSVREAALSRVATDCSLARFRATVQDIVDSIPCRTAEPAAEQAA